MKHSLLPWIAKGGGPDRRSQIDPYRIIEGSALKRQLRGIVPHRTLLRCARQIDQARDLCRDNLLTLSELQRVRKRIRKQLNTAALYQWRCEQSRTRRRRAH